MIRSVMLAATLAVAAGSAANACETGVYRAPSGEQAAVTKLPGGDLRYMLTDGRRGRIGSPDGLLVCQGLAIRSASNQGAEWARVPLKLTESRFKSHRETLSGILIEPPTPGPHPLVVFVHGSERSSPRLGYYPYILAAEGLTVFAYDKRGTGDSEGQYTQNFELLADDAAAALKEAKRLAAGRFDRAGYFGGSQGGWVAPLAATLAPTDFVAVGFGLISTPTEEDRDQVVSEMKEMGYDMPAIAEAVQLADAASAVAASHFTSGFDQFEALKKHYSSRPWFGRINGEYSGAMVRESDAQLRRIGQPEFDNVELIWNYDSLGTMARLKAPLLWVIAEKDREAPPELTLERLAALRDRGADVSVYSFPDTDHGIYEFTQASDGSRTVTRVSDGYFSLVADWIKGRVNGPYGRARKR